MLLEVAPRQEAVCEYLGSSVDEESNEICVLRCYTEKILFRVLLSWRSLVLCASAARTKLTITKHGAATPWAGSRGRVRCIHVGTVCPLCV